MTQEDVDWSVRVSVGHWQGHWLDNLQSVGRSQDARVSVVAVCVSVALVQSAGRASLVSLTTS